jgi:MYXO-CTERM domain-containing protein
VVVDGGDGGEDGGCSLAPSRSALSGVLTLIAAALLAARRRR